MCCVLYNIQNYDYCTDNPCARDREEGVGGLWFWLTLAMPCAVVRPLHNDDDDDDDDDDGTPAIT